MVAGLRLSGLVAQKAYDQPMNAAMFEEWVERCLVPTLSKGDIVVMDLLANPAMLQYIGTDKEAPGVNVTGLFYGNAYQFVLQIYGALFIIVLNAIATYIILKVISFIVPLRMDDAALKVGDDAVHGETAYAIGVEGE